MANFLLGRTKHRPKIGIICGSGLGSLAESVEDADIVPYQIIPNFPVSTVEGHAGQMIFGNINNVPVMVMQGRFHYYEGYPLAKCCMPIRVMKLVGVTHLIATNAAGGLNEKYNVGDIVIVKDHINLMGFAGNNPLQGPNDTRFGPRFPPMNKAYDIDMKKDAFEIAKELDIQDQVHEGVYTCLGGPNYETCAELKMLKILGVDCVGMSTVHEVRITRLFFPAPFKCIYFNWIVFHSCDRLSLPDIVTSKRSLSVSSQTNALQNMIAKKSPVMKRLLKLERKNNSFWPN